MDITIYHNHRCSKSRQTLALLQENGVDPTIVYYLDTPPDAEQLLKIVSKLDLPARKLVRFKEKRAGELGITEQDDRTERQWCELLADNPALIERPIVVRGNRAVIGRPPEGVLGLL